MRIWDLDVSVLCKNHLSGEHRELHAIWSVLTKGKKGYRNHPEVKRWDGKLLALKARHDAQVKEMDRRGWNHKSPLQGELPPGHLLIQTEFLHTVEEQIALLREKGCTCHV